MAESEQDKSEQPTAYKLMQARRKGVVARGMDLGFLTSLATVLGYFWLAGGKLGEALSDSMRAALVYTGSLADGPRAIAWMIESLAFKMFGPVIVLAGIVLLVTLVFEIVQTGLVFSSQPLKPDFSKLNPIQGLKKIFSLRMLVETIKNVLKLVFYTIAAIWVIRSTLRADAMAISDAEHLASLMATAAIRLLLAFALVALFFAALDQVLVRRQFLKTMRMSRREVRREMRDREGDPRLKQRRKQLHGEFVNMSQSMRNLRGADVLIVNPQHFAVGLRYDPGSMDAPMIVALGANQMAQRMKRLALLYSIPVIENPALARELWRKTALNALVPESCFAPVADIYNALGRQRKIEEPEE